MQKKLYLFNPDTDLALADGRANYLPPLAIRKMAKDLSLLPLWYAAKEEEAYCFKSDEKLLIKDFDEIIPWGWNPSISKQLRLLDIPEHLLPTQQELEHIRQLSNRSFAANLLKELITSDSYCGSATVLSSETAIEAFAKRFERTVFKAPWSSSGKGLRFCDGYLNETHKQWAFRILKIQGSIIGECLYNKVEDFAMEFYSDGKGKVFFIGYSLFQTDEHGKYKGNLLASDVQIETGLSNKVSREDLLQIKKTLIERLPSCLNDYKGHLGIDMMICQFPEEPVYRIHPCVEVNLRMNMGIVARCIADNHLAERSTGYFKIDYFANPMNLFKDHQEQISLFPLCKAGDKILSGYQALTPIDNTTNYRAAIWVE